MMKRKFTDDEIVNKKGDMNMSCTPWSNEKGRADYYENLYKEQFAEIERLKGWENLIKAEKRFLIKVEAIKEFAEMLKEKAMLHHGGVTVVYVSDIDKFIKEMTGENNGN